ncbi:MAG: hypothetical protein OIF36_01530 [Alphaproteobacteria bacterium]|jgi:hypothetical protein|nr:hypothetical protein [Alphaproteobacteria bacterium]MCV6599152.1 hypothetical protein [Alphaproteobacteria bacterium]
MKSRAGLDNQIIKAVEYSEDGYRHEIYNQIVDKNGREISPLYEAVTVDHENNCYEVQDDGHKFRIGSDMQLISEFKNRPSIKCSRVSDNKSLSESLETEDGSLWKYAKEHSKPIVSKKKIEPVKIKVKKVANPKLRRKKDIRVIPGIGSINLFR